jgi:hypothetical protein
VRVLRGVEGAGSPAAIRPTAVSKCSMSTGEVDSPGARPPGEAERGGAGLLAAVGGVARLVAGAAVLTRARRQELAHPSCHRRERDGGRRRIEAEVSRLSSVTAGTMTSSPTRLIGCGTRPASVEASTIIGGLVVPRPPGDGSEVSELARRARDVRCPGGSSAQHTRPVHQVTTGSPARCQATIPPTTL